MNTSLRWFGTVIVCALAFLSGNWNLTAAVIDKQVTLQPIQVCNDNGSVCASISYDQALTDKVWQQAGIDINWLPTTTWNSTSYLNIDGVGEPTFDDLIANGQGGSADPLVLNMWFIQDLDGTALGTAYIGEKYIVVDSGRRLDTAAHEIGHSLGLGHTTFGAGSANNLMTTGQSRTVINSINDVYPDGADLDFLNASQITAARGSSFAEDFTPVPEPEEWGLVVGSFLCLWMCRAKRSLKKQESPVLYDCA